MSALCLDLGSSMGWAVSRENNGTVRLKGNMTKKFEREGITDQDLKVSAYDAFESFLSDCFGLQGFCTVYYEEVVGNFNGSSAAKLYGGFECVLLQFCRDRDLECHGVAVGSIKKFARGLLPEDQQRNLKGNLITMNKDLMLVAATCAGFEPENHDHADAILMMLYIQEKTNE